MNVIIVLLVSNSNNFLERNKRRHRFFAFYFGIKLLKQTKPGSETDKGILLRGLDSIYSEDPLLHTGMLVFSFHHIFNNLVFIPNVFILKIRGQKKNV